MAKTKQYWKTTDGIPLREDVDGSVWIYRGGMWHASSYYQMQISWGQTSVKEITEDEAMSLIGKP